MCMSIVSDIYIKDNQYMKCIAYIMYVSVKVTSIIKNFLWSLLKAWSSLQAGNSSSYVKAGAWKFHMSVD
jgi:hypothetical protein